MFSSKKVPLRGQELKIIPGIDEGYVPESEVSDTLDPDKATVITSKVRNSQANEHKVIVDIDLPVHVEPSTTPGHFHLYIDKEISWDRYIVLLHALADAGIVEPGYVGASISRGYTSARLPWVKKGKGPKRKEDAPVYSQPATAEPY